MPHHPQMVPLPRGRSLSNAHCRRTRATPWQLLPCTQTPARFRTRAPHSTRPPPPRAQVCGGLCASHAHPAHTCRSRYRALTNPAEYQSDPRPSLRSCTRPTTPRQSSCGASDTVRHLQHRCARCATLAAAYQQASCPTACASLHAARRGSDVPPTSCPRTIVASGIPPVALLLSRNCA